MGKLCGDVHLPLYQTVTGYRNHQLSSWVSMLNASTRRISVDHTLDSSCYFTDTQKTILP